MLRPLSALARGYAWSRTRALSLCAEIPSPCGGLRRTMRSLVKSGMSYTVKASILFLHDVFAVDCLPVVTHGDGNPAVLGAVAAHLLRFGGVAVLAFEIVA